MIPGKLVSVIIATYNSAPFIVEALESVFRQTWQEIELIITDDGSGDDTVEVCRQWVNLNRKRFVCCEIHTSDKNTGIPANVNRGVNVAKGDWIKGLAGDDTLKPNCIEDNMLWISSHPEIKVLFSRVAVYREAFEPKNLINTNHNNPCGPNGIMAPDRDFDSQYKMLLIRDRIYFTPSVFLHREPQLSIGGYDERFKLVEDYPFWLNLTKNGYRLFFMDKVTVNYRQHSKAIFNSGINYLINPNYFRHEALRKVYTYPYLPSDVRLTQRYNWYISQIFRLNWLNRDKKSNRLLLYLLTIYLNPFKYFIYLRIKLNKNLKNNEFYMD